MYLSSDEFKQECLKRNRTLEAKIEIGSKIFLDDSIIDFSVKDSITSENDLKIGEAISSELNISLRTIIPIEDGEVVKPYLRLKTNEGYTEWLQLGVFTIDSRVNKNKTWNIVAYDDLTALLVPYESGLQFPATMVDVMNEIKTQTGIVFDESIQINSSFLVPYNNNTDPPTIRDVIAWIAGAHSSSARMSNIGKLKWIKLESSPVSSTEIPISSYFKLEKLNETRTITKVIVVNSIEGDNAYIEKGTGGAYNTLTIDNPYITHDMLDLIFNQINGFSYTPYSMSLRGLPYLEPGDALSFKRDESLSWLEIEIPWDDYSVPWDGLVEYNSIILNNEIIYRKGLLQNIDAESRSEKENEYQFTGTLDKKINQLKEGMVQEGKYYNRVKITRDGGIQVFDEDDMERLSLGNYEIGKYGIKLLSKDGNTVILSEDGILQTDTIHEADNVDATHPLKLKFYIDDGVISVNKVKLVFSLEKFRAYETGAEAGGAQINLELEYYELFTRNHIQISAPSYPYSHNHMMDHTHRLNLPNHTHQITYGIYEGTEATGVKVKVDGVERLNNGGSGYSTDQNNLDLTEWITAAGWHTIELTSTQLGRINASIYIKSFVGV